MQLISYNAYISTDALYSSNSYLAHHGVKGMKWGVRNERETGGPRKPGLIKRRLQAEIARGRKMSRTRSGEKSFVKRNIVAPLKYGVKGAALGLLTWGATMGTFLGTTILTANPIVATYAATGVATAFGSAATISLGRDQFDRVLANGAYLHDKIKERKSQNG